MSALKGPFRPRAKRLRNAEMVASINRQWFDTPTILSGNIRSRPVKTVAKRAVAIGQCETYTTLYAVRELSATLKYAFVQAIVRTSS